MATRSAIVLGAGMVGVASALHLRRRGWPVALIDRNDVGLETSYGNAGIIQSEAVRPYAMPHIIGGLIERGLTDWSNTALTTDDRGVADTLAMGATDHNVRLAIRSGVPQLG